MFDHAVATAPEKVALRHSGASLTYREVGRAATALAQRLAPIVKPGEVVALVLPNSIEFHIAYFAALKALAAPRPAQPSLPVGPTLAATAGGESTSRRLCAGDAGDGGRSRRRSGHSRRGLPGAGVCRSGSLSPRPRRPLGLRPATPTDPGALLFSGGTTGLPKDIEHTHGRLAAAVRCIQHMWPMRTDDEVFLPIAPFTHVYGFLMGVLAPLSARGETVIPERFQPEHIVELLARYRVTFFGGGPPAIYAGLLEPAQPEGR